MKTGVSIRQELSQSLYGIGLEFSPPAFDTAFPIPATAQILRPDPNRELNLAGMEGIQPGSLNFIIANHVIQHARNPIKALRTAHEKLTKGGRLFLVVSDQETTFNRTRPPTTIEHLVADYLMPCRGRDFEHYLEFFGKCLPQEDPVTSARGMWEGGGEIHFHTWTYASFQQFLAHVNEHYVPWHSVWSNPRLSDQDQEFFFILTK